MPDWHGIEEIKSAVSENVMASALWLLRDAISHVLGSSIIAVFSIEQVSYVITASAG